MNTLKTLNPIAKFVCIALIGMFAAFIMCIAFVLMIAVLYNFKFVEITRTIPFIILFILMLILSWVFTTEAIWPAGE